ncbi:MAG: hypothetical protein ACI319_10045 [Holdemanella porci]
MSSFNVGIPFLKCSMQPASRQEGKQAPKTGYATAVWREFFDERAGRDPDIKHAYTKDNVWLIEPGTRSADEYTKMMQSYLDKMSEDRRSHGLRGLRKDCVCAVNGIVKVPIDYINTHPEFDSTAFYRDAVEVLQHLCQDDRRCGIIDSAVIHKDEYIDLDKGLKSDHLHFNIIPLVNENIVDKETGELVETVPSLNAKQFFNTVFLDKINREFRKMMREKGWEVDDCQMYDSAIITDDDIDKGNKKGKKKQQKSKRRGGQDSATYKAEAERNKLRAIELEKELTKQNKELFIQRSDLKGEIQRINDELVQTIEDKKKAESKLSELCSIKDERQYLETNQEADRGLTALKACIDDVEDQLEDSESHEWSYPYIELFKQYLIDIQIKINNMKMFEVLKNKIEKLSAKFKNRVDSLADRIDKIDGTNNKSDNKEKKKELER